MVNRVNERTEDVCCEPLLEERRRRGARPRHLAGLLVSGYATLALLWLLLSFPHLHPSAVPTHMLHDLAFVGVTGVMLFIAATKIIALVVERERRAAAHLEAQRQALERANRALRAFSEATLRGWSRVLDLRDHETEEHSARVTALTVRLARAMGITGEELEYIRQGAMLHDIGKIGVPDAILRKAGALAEEEWAVMRRHPELAYDLLAPIGFSRPVLDIAYYHHERWNGSGYPLGLMGEQIPLAARIFAVVDVWDALRSDRPYRRAWSQERALHYLKAHAGTLFDPGVVRAFCALIEAERQEGGAFHRRVA
ncbi:MAG: HD-GYP domain-containing protein [Oscillochloridaceae bacterium]|nr:HD-GYP domain-containing protein [Chloroflexaceae bacterium]MDW8391491.1 HD-GYP domain-containing protein [Oscillochloridaceae bacterium]